jgi:hypothetical protein
MPYHFNQKVMLTNDIILDFRIRIKKQRMGIIKWHDDTESLLQKASYFNSRFY